MSRKIMIENIKITDEVLLEKYSQPERIIIFRDANQRYLFTLHSLCELVSGLDNKEALNIYNTLVGASFSMWRAAFLTEDNRSEKQTFENGVKILEYLIKHNSISYMEEFKHRNWVMGFYLNNAKLRILQIGEKLKKNNVHHLIDLERIEELSLTKISDMNWAWIRLHNTLVDIYCLLENIANKKQKLF